MYVHGALSTECARASCRPRAPELYLVLRAKKRLVYLARTRYGDEDDNKPTPHVSFSYSPEPNALATPHHTTPHHTPHNLTPQTWHNAPRTRVRARTTRGTQSFPAGHLRTHPPISKSSSHLRTPRHAHIDPSKPEKFEARVRNRTRPSVPQAFEPVPRARAAQSSPARAREARGEKGRSPREPRGPQFYPRPCLSPRPRPSPRPQPNPRLPSRANADFAKHAQNTYLQRGLVRATRRGRAHVLTRVSSLELKGEGGETHLTSPCSPRVALSSTPVASRGSRPKYVRLLISIRRTRTRYATVGCVDL